MKRWLLLLPLLLLAAPCWGAEAVVLGVNTTSTANAAAYTSGSFTPAAGDLLVAFVTASDTVAAGTMRAVLGINFTKVTSVLSRTSLDTTYLFVANVPAVATSQTVTFDCTGDNATGVVITVLRVSGSQKFGLEAVIQTAVSANQTAGGTPAITFGSSVLTGNPTLVAVANSTNPAGVTEPTSWTERSDAGYNTPPTGQETASRDSGFTGTTVTWGSTSASDFAAIGIELDSTACLTICIKQAVYTGSSSGSSIGFSYPANITANNALYVGVGISDAASTISTISNTCGDTFTESGSSPVTGGASRLRVYTTVTAGGCSTITITQSGTSASVVFGLELIGVKTSSIVDCTANGTGTSTALLTGNCVTTKAAELLIAMGYQPVGGAVAYTPGASFVGLQSDRDGTGHTGQDESRKLSSTGTFTGSITSSSNSEWDIHILGLINLTQPAVAGQVGPFLVGP